LETHIFGNIENRNYGKVKVEFLEFIRENKKFDSLENLKTQIEKDIKIAKSKI
jgi:riboflavin kinase/FMN adenylyltransferase